MFAQTFVTNHKLPLLFIVLSIALYVLFAFDLDRSEHLKLLVLYSLLFFSFYNIIRSKGLSINFLIGLAVLFRLIFLFSIPNLSQDFYRFIWDGRMILKGFNPYLYTPLSFIEAGQFPVFQAQELYKGMGELNGSHFTNYPPINQLCFAIAGIFGAKSILGSVIILKLIILLADIGIIFFARKLLKSLKLNERNIFWFILNPLIIIELTGNLHFEGVMILFLVWGIYLLQKGNWQWAGILIAFSISTKLIPLMFLPIFMGWFVKFNLGKFFKGKGNDTVDANSTQSLEVMKSETSGLGIFRLVVFYLIVGLTTLLLFLPFYSSQFISNYSQTVSLWFQNFEFNASIYYIIREIGYLYQGYNEIAIIGKWTAIFVVIFIIVLSLLRKNHTIQKLIEALVIAFSIYLFTTTTVHPWYLATLLALSVFTSYKFPLIWSATVILSYLAYKTTGVQENWMVLVLEYAIVIGVFIYEVVLAKPRELAKIKT